MQQTVIGVVGCNYCCIGSRSV